MLRVERGPLPVDLQSVLDKWQQAVDTRNPNLIQPDRTRKIIADWQSAIDHHQPVGGIPWEAFGKIENENKARLLQILHGSFYGKCAYCEMRSELEIDHYIPKSAYPTKMFVWDNMLPACTACNTRYKKGAMQWGYDGKPVLLNPCVDDPLYYLDIIQMTTDQHRVGDIQPQNNLSGFEHERATYTINKLGLKRRESLQENRADVIEMFLALYKYLEVLEDPDFPLKASGNSIREQFARILHPKKPYLAAIRQCFHQKPEVKAYLLEQIPDLEPLITQWALPLTRYD